VEEGLHLGYRKAKGRPGKPSVAGKWVVRRYVGDQNYEVETVASADDFSDADGIAILKFRQAQDKARQMMVSLAHAAAKGPMLNVRTVVEAYVAERDKRESRRKGRPVRSDAAQRLSRYVLGQDARGEQEAIGPAKLADVELGALTEDDLSGWRDGLPD